MPRQDGQHWNTLLDNIPEGFPVTVVSRHKHRLEHPRITELVHLTEPPKEYDEKWLGRPLKLNFGDSVEMVKVIFFFFLSNKNNIYSGDLE